MNPLTLISFAMLSALPFMAGVVYVATENVLLTGVVTVMIAIGDFIMLRILKKRLVTLPPAQEQEKPATPQSEKL